MWSWIKVILVIQIVKEASCTVNQKVISKINNGFLIYVGVKKSDTIEDLQYCVNKITKLRLFTNKTTLKISDNIVDVDGEILAIPNFTLLGDVTNNNRPSFINAAEYSNGEFFYNQFCEKLSSNLSKNVQKGQFGADMKIQSVVDGPVNLIINSEDKITK